MENGEIQLSARRLNKEFVSRVKQLTGFDLFLLLPIDSEGPEASEAVNEIIAYQNRWQGRGGADIPAPETPSFDFFRRPAEEAEEGETEEETEEEALEREKKDYAHLVYEVKKLRYEQIERCFVRSLTYEEARALAIILSRHQKEIVAWASPWKYLDDVRIGARRLCKIWNQIHPNNTIEPDYSNIF